MKVLFVIAALALLSCCAPSPNPTWNMTWNCDGNVNCASHMGAWNGSGSFANETDCLVWETSFLNDFGAPWDSVTSCTEVN